VRRWNNAGFIARRLGRIRKARAQHGAMLWPGVSLSVCLSVSLTQTGVLSKQLERLS